jgi:pyruvate dehydrogenase E1 component beta subunit
MIDAIKSALDSEMKKDKSVIVIGEDVGINGGVFRATDGLFKKYGPDRVIDTPLTEEGIMGNAVGLALNGLKPVVEIQFSAFMAPAFDQIFTHASKMRTRSRGRFTCPLVVRGPSGGGIRALELHCENPEAYYAHIPGVKVVYPSTPYDAKGLLISAIRDPDPVIFLEPMRIYRAIKEEVPDKAYTIPLGKAKVVREGTDLTVVSWGAMVKYAGDAIEKIADKIDVELIDLRTIYPFDINAILKSLEKTGKLVIIHEAPKTSGFGAEIAASVAEKGLDYLEAPIKRITGYDTALPFAKMELDWIPSEERIIKGIKEVMDY